MTGFAALKRYFAQFGRFAIVGVTNSVVDIGMTNWLVYLLNPVTVQALFGISLIACLTATFNSFILNRLWTFRESPIKSDSATVVRFFLIAFLTILINTSIFLFLFSYLERHFTLSKWLILNVSKVIAIGCSSVFSFLGYKFGVFNREQIRKFKEMFAFSDHHHEHSLGSFPVLFAVACGVRLIYCVMVHGPFPVWEQGIAFLCGVLLLVPTMLIAQQLFGRPVALLTGWLCAVHPRLVEFSCQGPMASFDLLVYISLVWLMTYLMNRYQSVVLSSTICAVALVIGVAVQGELRPLSSWSPSVFELLRRLPGVMATPVALFAFLLPFMARVPIHIHATSTWLLCTMLILPVLLYPFFDVVPWFLMSLILPLQIFGAAGLTAFSIYLGKKISWPYLYRALVGAMIAFSLAVTLLKSL